VDARTPHPMLTWTRSSTGAAAVLFLASLGLAGCSTTTSGTVTHTPALGTVGGRATAREVVQTAILAAQTSNGLAISGGPTPASIVRMVLAHVHGRRALAAGNATGACSNGVKQSVTINGGQTITTTDLYYEATCVTLENEEVITFGPAGTSSTPGTGTLTTYDKGGNVTSFHNLTITYTPPASSASTATETVDVRDDGSTTKPASGASQSIIASWGANCTGVPNAQTMTCYVAHNGTATSTLTGGTASTATNTGEAFTETITGSTGGGNATNSIVETFYIGSLSISEISGIWSVTGAAGFNSSTGSFGFTKAGTTGTGTFTMTDVLYNYQVTGTLASTGLTVTIVEGTTNPVSIGTATVDAGGNGTISYADGSSETIWGSMVGD